MPMSSHPSPTQFRPADAPTTVGVDVGLKTLLAAAPASAEPDVGDALLAGGGTCHGLFNDLLAALEDCAPPARTEVVARYREQILDEMADAIAQLLDYLDTVDADVVVLEDLGHERKALADYVEDGEDAGAYILPELLARLETVLVAEGYAVGHVSPKYTSKLCHHCEEFGELGESTLRCTTDTCPVDTVCRDRSAAVTIATRGTRG
jgi:hypothetical protein